MNERRLSAERFYHLQVSPAQQRATTERILIFTRHHPFHLLHRHHNTYAHMHDTRRRNRHNAWFGLRYQHYSRNSRGTDSLELSGVPEHHILPADLAGRAGNERGRSRQKVVVVVAAREAVRGWGEQGRLVDRKLHRRRQDGLTQVDALGLVELSRVAVGVDEEERTLVHVQLLAHGVLTHTVAFRRAAVRCSVLVSVLMSLVCNLGNVLRWRRLGEMARMSDAMGAYGYQERRREFARALGVLWVILQRPVCCCLVKVINNQ